MESLARIQKKEGLMLIKATYSSDHFLCAMYVYIHIVLSPYGDLFGELPEFLFEQQQAALLWFSKFYTLVPKKQKDILRIKKI